MVAQSVFLLAMEDAPKMNGGSLVIKHGEIAWMK
jgi:hypothetical protein